MASDILRHLLRAANTTILSRSGPACRACNRISGPEMKFPFYPPGPNTPLIELKRRFLSSGYEIRIDGVLLPITGKLNEPFMIPFRDGAEHQIILKRNRNPIGPPRIFLDSKEIVPSEPIRFYDLIVAAVPTGTLLLFYKYNSKMSESFGWVAILSLILILLLGLKLFQLPVKRYVHYVHITYLVIIIVLICSNWK